MIVCLACLMMVYAYLLPQINWADQSISPVSLDQQFHQWPNQWLQQGSTVAWQFKSLPLFPKHISEATTLSKLKKKKRKKRKIEKTKIILYAHFTMLVDMTFSLNSDLQRLSSRRPGAANSTYSFNVNFAPQQHVSSGHSQNNYSTSQCLQGSLCLFFLVNISQGQLWGFSFFFICYFCVLAVIQARWSKNSTFKKSEKKSLNLTLHV